MTNFFHIETHHNQRTPVLLAPNLKVSYQFKQIYSPPVEIYKQYQSWIDKYGHELARYRGRDFFCRNCRVRWYFKRPDRYKPLAICPAKTRKMDKEELQDISLAKMFQRERRKSEVEFNKRVDLSKIYNYSRTSDNNDDTSGNNDETSYNDDKTSDIQLPLRSKHTQRRRLRISLYSSVVKYTLRRLVKMKKRQISAEKVKQLEEMFPRFG
jgi:hypothetical protein